MLATATFVQPLALAVMTLATIPAGNARRKYLDRPVTIVFCFPPGGSTDVAVR